MELGLIFLLILIVPLIIIPAYIRSGDVSPYRTVIWAVLITCAAAAAVFVIASMRGASLFSQIQDSIHSTAESMADNETIVEAFDLGEASKTERVNTISSMYNSMFDMMPAIILESSVIVSYFEYLIISRVMARRRTVDMMPAFREFSFPRSTVFILIGIYLLVWILTMTGAFTNNAMYSNIYSLIDFAFCIQGASVIMMFFHRRQWPKAVSIIVIILLWMIASIILAIVGVIDLAFGLKARIKGRGNNREG